jgi:ligand-binding sensor domain-containing protein/DNA-binding CsgD family transcriptional regulator
VTEPGFFSQIKFNFEKKDYSMVKRILIVFILGFILPVMAFAEIKKIGTPFIRNFLKREYKAGTQNWDVEQDKRGFIYFANNEGLLMYDGNQWQLYKMPNSSIVRALFVSKSGEIYVGAYNEFGKMVCLPNGKMVFKSLKKFIPLAYQNFDDIWSVFSFENKIIFQSYNCAFVCSNDSNITVLKAPVRFHHAFKVNDRVFFNDLNAGLFEYDGKRLSPIPATERLKGLQIWSILPLFKSNDLLIATLNDGIFLYNGKTLEPWGGPINDFLKKNQVFCATTIQDKYYVVGTIQNGVVIIDRVGNIIQHFCKNNGLQNNTILSVFTDRSDNLWLGLDNGIDYVNINSSITYLQNPDGIGAGYVAIVNKGKLYLGTNQGLFVADWRGEEPISNLRLVQGTVGQVWSLEVFDGELVCGHNNGTFLIEGEQAVNIDRTPGGWKYMQLKNHPHLLIAGTYSGLILFTKEGNHWRFSKKINGFNESFRIFEEDQNGDIWMSHGFKGIFKINLNNALDSVISSRFYNSSDGLPTNYNLNVYKIKNKIVFTSKLGVYEYNAMTDRFEKSVFFNQLLYPVTDISYLKEDRKGDIWYIAWMNSVNSAGLLKIKEDFTYQHVSSPFAILTGKFVSGFESVYEYAEDHYFIGTEDGFAHYKPSMENVQNPEFSTYITKAIAIYQDSTFYFGNNYSGQNRKQKNAYLFPYKGNSFRFIYSSPTYDNSGNIEYSYKLSGFAENWSMWSSSFSKEYTNLPEGDYIFAVKARNQLGVLSLEDQIEFSVLPPWYRTLLAYLIYFILAICIIFVTIWLIYQRIEASKRKDRLHHLQAYKQKEQEYLRNALIDEKKIINLKNEKLRAEMIHRNKELANQTLDLIRKSKFLLNIKDELLKLKRPGIDPSLNDKISSLIAKIDRDIDHNKQWEVFESAFDEVHEDFLNRIKNSYPNLTPKELRLCAYLRLNISSKEIAPLMNISVRGVEICRYRVRKKLEIDRDTNMTSFIINF